MPPPPRTVVPLANAADAAGETATGGVPGERGDSGRSAGGGEGETSLFPLAGGGPGIASSAERGGGAAPAAATGGYGAEDPAPSGGPAGEGFEGCPPEPDPIGATPGGRIPAAPPAGGSADVASGGEGGAGVAAAATGGDGAEGAALPMASAGERWGGRPDGADAPDSSAVGTGFAEKAGDVLAPGKRAPDGGGAGGQAAGAAPLTGASDGGDGEEYPDVAGSVDAAPGDGGGAGGAIPGTDDGSVGAEAGGHAAAGGDAPAGADGGTVAMAVPAGRRPGGTDDEGERAASVEAADGTAEGAGATGAVVAPGCAAAVTRVASPTEDTGRADVGRPGRPESASAGPDDGGGAGEEIPEPVGRSAAAATGASGGGGGGGGGGAVEDAAPAPVPPGARGPEWDAGSDPREAARCAGLGGPIVAPNAPETKAALETEGAGRAEAGRPDGPGPVDAAPSDDREAEGAELAQTARDEGAQDGAAAADASGTGGVAGGAPAAPDADGTAAPALSAGDADCGGAGMPGGGGVDGRSWGDADGAVGDGGDGGATPSPRGGWRQRPRCGAAADPDDPGGSRSPPPTAWRGSRPGRPAKGAPAPPAPVLRSSRRCTRSGAGFASPGRAASPSGGAASPPSVRRQSRSGPLPTPGSPPSGRHRVARSPRPRSAIAGGTSPRRKALFGGPAGARGKRAADGLSGADASSGRSDRELLVGEGREETALAAASEAERRGVPVAAAAGTGAGEGTVPKRSAGEGCGGSADGHEPAVEAPPAVPDEAGPSEDPSDGAAIGPGSRPLAPQTSRRDGEPHTKERTSSSQMATIEARSSEHDCPVAAPVGTESVGAALSEGGVTEGIAPKTTAAQKDTSDTATGASALALQAPCSGGLDDGTDDAEERASPARTMDGSTEGAELGGPIASPDVPIVNVASPIGATRETDGKRSGEPSSEPKTMAAATSDDKGTEAPPVVPDESAPVEAVSPASVPPAPQGAVRETSVAERDASVGTASASALAPPAACGGGLNDGTEDAGERAGPARATDGSTEGAELGGPTASPDVPIANVASPTGGTREAGRKRTGEPKTMAAATSDGSGTGAVDLERSSVENGTTETAPVASPNGANPDVGGAEPGDVGAMDGTGADESADEGEDAAGGGTIAQAAPADVKADGASSEVGHGNPTAEESSGATAKPTGEERGEVANIGDIDASVANGAKESEGTCPSISAADSTPVKRYPRRDRTTPSSSRRRDDLASPSPSTPGRRGSVRQPDVPNGNGRAPGRKTPSRTAASPSPLAGGRRRSARLSEPPGQTRSGAHYASPPPSAGGGERCRRSRPSSDASRKRAGPVRPAGRSVRRKRLFGDGDGDGGRRGPPGDGPAAAPVGSVEEPETGAAATPLEGSRRASLAPHRTPGSPPSGRREPLPPRVLDWLRRKDATPDGETDAAAPTASPPQRGQTGDNRPDTGEGTGTARAASTGMDPGGASKRGECGDGSILSTACGRCDDVTVSGGPMEGARSESPGDPVPGVDLAEVAGTDQLAEEGARPDKAAEVRTPTTRNGVDFPRAGLGGAHADGNDGTEPTALRRAPADATCEPFDDLGPVNVVSDNTDNEEGAEPGGNAANDRGSDGLTEGPMPAALGSVDGTAPGGDSASIGVATDGPTMAGSAASGGTQVASARLPCARTDVSDVRDSGGVAEPGVSRRFAVTASVMDAILVAESREGRQVDLGESVPAEAASSVSLEGTMVAGDQMGGGRHGCLDSLVGMTERSDNENALGLTPDESSAVSPVLEAVTRRDSQSEGPDAEHAVGTHVVETLSALVRWELMKAQDLVRKRKDQDLDFSPGKKSNLDRLLESERSYMRDHAEDVTQRSKLYVPAVSTSVPEKKHNSQMDSVAESDHGDERATLEPKMVEVGVHGTSEQVSLVTKSVAEEGKKGPKHVLEKEELIDSTRREGRRDSLNRQHPVNTEADMIGGQDDGAQEAEPSLDTQLQGSPGTSKTCGCACIEVACASTEPAVLAPPLTVGKAGLSIRSTEEGTETVNESSDAVTGAMAISYPGSGSPSIATKTTPLANPKSQVLSGRRGEQAERSYGTERNGESLTVLRGISIEKHPRKAPAASVRKSTKRTGETGGIRGSWALSETWAEDIATQHLRQSYDTHEEDSDRDRGDMMPGETLIPPAIASDTEKVEDRNQEPSSSYYDHEVNIGDELMDYAGTHVGDVATEPFAVDGVATSPEKEAETTPLTEEVGSKGKKLSSDDSEAGHRVKVSCHTGSGKYASGQEEPKENINRHKDDMEGAGQVEMGGANDQEEVKHTSVAFKPASSDGKTAGGKAEYLDAAEVNRECFVRSEAVAPPGENIAEINRGANGSKLHDMQSKKVSAQSGETPDKEFATKVNDKGVGQDRNKIDDSVEGDDAFLPAGPEKTVRESIAKERGNRSNDASEGLKNPGPTSVAAKMQELATPVKADRDPMKEYARAGTPPLPERNLQIDPKSNSVLPSSRKVAMDEEPEQGNSINSTFDDVATAPGTTQEGSNNELTERQKLGSCIDSSLAPAELMAEKSKKCPSHVGAINSAQDPKGTNIKGNATPALSPAYIAQVQSLNLERLKRVVTEAEEAIAVVEEKANPRTSKAKSKLKDSVCAANGFSDMPFFPERELPSRKSRPLTLKEPTFHPKGATSDTTCFRRKLHKILSKHAGSVGEALSLFQRGVDANAEDGRGVLIFPCLEIADNCGKAGPTAMENNHQKIPRDTAGLSDNASPGHDPTLNEKRLTSMALSMYATEKTEVGAGQFGTSSELQMGCWNHSEMAPEVVQRAERILGRWRSTLRVKDHISASDYLDEYELGDETLGWVKVYDAVVLAVKRGTDGDGENDDEEEKKQSSSSLSIYITLGDSSLKKKELYQLQKGELAIRVNYVGYPMDQNRWLLLDTTGENKNKKSMDFMNVVVPFGCHAMSVGALKRARAITDSDQREEGKAQKNAQEEAKAEEIHKSTIAALEPNKLRNGAKVKRSRKSRDVKGRSKSKSAADSASPYNYTRENHDTTQQDTATVAVVGVRSVRDGSEKLKGATKTEMHRDEWTENENRVIAEAIASECKEGGALKWRGNVPPCDFWKCLIEKHLPHKTIRSARVQWHKIRSRYWTEYEDQIITNALKELGNEHPDPSLLETVSQDLEMGLLSHRLWADIKKRYYEIEERGQEKNGITNGMKRSSLRKRSSTSFYKPSEAKRRKVTEKDQSESLLRPAANGSKKHRAPARKGASKQNSRKLSRQGRTDESITIYDKTNLAFTWICTECREAECISNPDSPLLVCEGECNRPFHYPCAGLAAVPTKDEKWICNDCEQTRHQCTVCREYGADGKDVHKCDKKSCGLFYHENCLSMYDVDVVVVERTVEVVEKSNEEPVPRTITRPRFKCPAHSCWTCSGGAPPDPLDTMDDDAKCTTKRKKGPLKSTPTASFFGEKKDLLFRCLDCPISYHSTCIPPACRFHELALLCHEHYRNKLPDLDVKNSYQAEVEKFAESKLEEMRKKKRRKSISLVQESGETSDENEMEEEDELNSFLPFLPGMKGDLVSPEQQKLMSLLCNEEEVEGGSGSSKPGQLSFCLPCDFQEEVHSKPPMYTHVHSNRYDPTNRPKRHPPSDEACQCKPSADAGVPSCDEQCLNRILMMECIGDNKRTNGENNPYWNCNHGPECGNRKLSQRKFAKCRPKREQGKGWGLITVNGVKKGDLVTEYVGEIVDEQDKRDRLSAWSRDHPNDPNFYIMQLEPGWYIDAREKGNLSRFINHSCDPNCHLEPVNVAGNIRVAIVAICDVPPGGFLSYDYQFDTKHGERFLCRCGATKCRGTMKGVKKGDESGKEQKKTKKEKWQDAKARYERDKKFIDEVSKSERQRLCLVGQLVPGEPIDGSDTVASGPQEKYRDYAQKYRIFLWRTALLGADFAARHWRRLGDSKRGKHKGKSGSCLPPIDFISTMKKAQSRVTW